MANFCNSLSVTPFFAGLSTHLSCHHQSPCPHRLSICHLMGCPCLRRLVRVWCTRNVPFFVPVPPFNSSLSLSGAGVWEDFHGRSINAGRHLTGANTFRASDCDSALLRMIGRNDDEGRRLPSKSLLNRIGCPRHQQSISHSRCCASSGQLRKHIVPWNNNG